MLRAEFIISTVLNALDVLRRETDLSPRNEAVNRTLGHLVETLAATCETIEEDTVLDDPRIKTAAPLLLRKLARAEGEMEKFWAGRFLQKDTLSLNDLREFRYWHNYETLVTREAAHLEGLRGAIAFAGAGALPLTAILLHLKTGCRVTCIDRDPEACEKAAALVEKLGLRDVRVVCADAADADYEDYDAVFVASLIPNAAKEKILERIAGTESLAFVAIRSAERLHTLLYEPFRQDNAALGGYEFIGKTEQSPAAINTTLIYRPEAQYASLPVKKLAFS